MTISRRDVTDAERLPEYARLKRAFVAAVVETTEAVVEDEDDKRIADAYNDEEAAEEGLDAFVVNLLGSEPSSGRSLTPEEAEAYRRIRNRLAPESRGAGPDGTLRSRVRRWLSLWRQSLRPQQIAGLEMVLNDVDHIGTQPDRSAEPECMDAFHDRLGGPAGPKVCPSCRETWKAKPRASGEPERTPEPCRWAPNRDGVYESACGGMFALEAGTPAENEMRYCPYCGRPLETP